jgi:hypothetical protein
MHCWVLCAIAPRETRACWEVERRHMATSHSPTTTNVVYVANVPTRAELHCLSRQSQRVISLTESALAVTSCEQYHLNQTIVDENPIEYKTFDWHLLAHLGYSVHVGIVQSSPMLILSAWFISGSSFWLVSGRSASLSIPHSLS